MQERKKKGDPKVSRNLNAFIRHKRGKCVIFAYIQPIPELVECLLENNLASGVGFWPGAFGREVGSWFTGSWKRNVQPGPGGVEYQGFPSWEEVEPPGKPLPVDGPVKYVSELSPESIAMIKESDLFTFSFLNSDPDGRVPGYIDVFGQRFVPGLISESDASLYPYLRKQHEKKPFADRDEAYAAALDYIRNRACPAYPYGLSGSGVTWYQGGALSKQKRWDHEIANGNFQVQNAFLRGVAQQHDIPFLTYVAPMGNSREGLWGTKADPDTPFRKVFNCTYFHGGKPDDLLEREWFCAWFNGPEAVVIESAAFYLFKEDKTSKTIVPGCMADACKKLNHLAFDSDFDRGTPVKPGCILLDERHGWDMPCGSDAHNWDPPEITRRKIWGVFDYQHQDIMVDNFFGAVFPGYEHGGNWGCEPGDLVQTPYGDSFDVLMSNARGKALDKYPAVFPVGQPKLTKAFKNRLEQYVEAGGNLVLNIRQVDYEWQKFLGVKFSPKYNRWYTGLGTLRASDWSEWIGSRRLWKEERYHYSRFEAKKAEVLALTEQGDPLVVCNERGKGKVYLVAAHYMQEISGLHRPNGLLNISRFLIGHVLAPYQGLRVRGPDIHYQVNRTESGLSVLLLNNSDSRWNGWLSFPGMGKAVAREWYAEERVHTHTVADDLSVRLDIPGHSLRILSVEG